MADGITGGWAVTDPEVVKQYSKDMTVAIMQDSKWSQLMGRGDDAVIKTKVELGVKDGDNVTMRMRGLIRGSGITGDTSFIGNEDEIPYLYQKVSAELQGNSVQSPGRLSDQRDAINFRSDANDGLRDWNVDTMDRKIYTRLSDSATNVVVSGHYLDIAVNNLTTSDTLSTADIDEMARRAKKGVKSDGSSKNVASPRLRPVRTMRADGKIVRLRLPMYLLKVGAESANNLRQDTTWISGHENAASRGQENAIFTGELGTWNGVVVVEDGTETTEYAGIKTGTDGGSGGNLPYEKNLMVGATAMLMPMSGGVQYYEFNAQDPRFLHVGTDHVFGLAKTKYTASADNDSGLASAYYNNDYGVIVNVAYAVN